MTHKIPVIHFTESLATGVLHVVKALANASAERGVPTAVVHGRRPETPEQLAGLFDPSVRLVEVPGFGDRSFRGAAGLARSVRMLREELDRHDGGIVHIHSTYAGVVGRLVPARGWRVLYSPHGYAFLNPAHPPWIRRSVRLAEGALARRGTTIAASETEGHEAKRLPGRPRVRVVANGIGPRPAAVEPSVDPADGGRLLVAAVGRAAPQRCPDLFADVAVRFTGDDAPRFVWYGDGVGRPTLEAAGVEVSGWLPAEEVPVRLDLVDIVLHLSLFEGLPLALLESMRAERSIIASDLPVLREVGGDAVLFAADADAAERQIRALGADDVRREELGRGAAARVAELFTVEKMVSKMLSVYGLAENDGV